MGLLDRLRITAYRRKADEPALEGGFGFGPQLFHGTNVLARDRPSAAELHAHDFRLLHQPSRADPEEKTAAGITVERGDFLRQRDRFMFGNQTNPGAKFYAGCYGSGQCQGYERIGQMPIVVRHLILTVLPAGTP